MTRRSSCSSGATLATGAKPSRTWSGIGSTDGAQTTRPRAHRRALVRNEACDTDAHHGCEGRPRLLQRRGGRVDRTLVPRHRAVAGFALAGALRAEDARQAAADAAGNAERHRPA